MRIKQKWKFFWTLKSKANAGFTLVELIVVIAILAILAGVGVPAYSGYVEKADRAADKQLLADVNKAFAAACLSVGVDNYNAPGAAANVEEMTVTITGDKANDFADMFDTFFDNEGKFKKTTRLEYTPEIGGFVDPDTDSNEGKTVAITLDGKTYYISQTAIDNFKAATAFSENIDELQARVDGLSGAYTEFIGDVTEEELEAKFGKEYVEYLKKNGITKDQMGNATVLYVAGKSANMTAEDAYNQLLGTHTYLQNYKAVNNGQTPSLTEYMESFKAGGDPLATTAMLYGAVTAYVNGPGKNDTTLSSQLANVKDSGTLLTLITSATENEGFLQYCSQPGGGYTPSNQFITDMNGYLGALEGINSSSGAFKDDLGNGNLWTGENAETLLGQIGK